MSFLKLLRGNLANLPEQIKDGFIYFTKDKKGLYIDADGERKRVNPPADWNETDPDLPSYIVNKPTTIAGYGITDAAKIYYNTTAGWAAQITRVSEEGAIYVYSDNSTIEKDGETINVPAIKIGDGLAYVVDLPFSQDQSIIDHINNDEIHITTTDREFWNNKCSVDATDISNERLILTTD